jgi:ABC-type transport system involved in cytochrome c biogenesis permease subunit
MLLILGFGAVLFTYFGNLFLGGLHSYGGLR